ncbi:hypothetical protein, partial [Bacteroides faecis]|uniref:hypothetical protein n=1 Tax=Bacteroides faecis TaxID=674529 RepID=UPI003563B47E
ILFIIYLIVQRYNISFTFSFSIIKIIFISTTFNTINRSKFSIYSIINKNTVSNITITHRII